MSALKGNPDLFQPYAAIGCELPNKVSTGPTHPSDTLPKYDIEIWNGI